MTYILRNRESNDQFNLKYKTLVDGFSGKDFFGVYWSVITLSRWTLTSIILVFMRDYYGLQIIICLIMSILA